MGFVIQWLIYLAAFVAGSAVAYGIVAVMTRSGSRQADSGRLEPAETAIEPEMSESQAHPAESESPQPLWPDPSFEPEPETVELHVEPEPAPELETDEIQSGP